MPRTGRFGGFDFDPEVFSEFMSENPTWNDAIIASGVLAENNNHGLNRRKRKRCNNSFLYTD